MNVRLASLLFLSITFSTPLCANDEVSSKFVKCAEIVLNGLVHCSEKIGTFAYEGLIRSPEITKGAATIVVSGAALYGTYKAAYVIPAFFKYVKDSLSNLAFFPGRVAETNENAKFLVDKLRALEAKVDSLKKIVLSYGTVFNRFGKCVENNFNSMKKEQNEQTNVLNRVDNENKQIHTELISVDGKVDDLGSGVNILKRDMDYLREEIFNIRGMTKATNGMVADLHALDLKNYIENVTQANEFLVAHVEEIHKEKISGENNGQVCIEVAGKEKERRGGGGFFTHVVTPKFVAMEKRVKESEANFVMGQRALDSKVNDTDRKLEEIKSLLVTTLNAQNREIEKKDKQIQELVQYQVFVKLLEIGVNQKMEVEAQNNGYAYVNHNSRSTVQSSVRQLTPTPLADFSRGRNGMSSGLFLPYNSK